MSGPPPTPTRLKILRGNPHRHPLNKTEPQPKAGSLVCPPQLGPTARKEWRRVVKALPKGMVTQVDAGNLTAYCEAYGRWMDAKRELGPANTWKRCSKTGYEFMSPWLKVATKAFDQMLKAAAELGFTPASRSRVHTVEDATVKNDLEDLLTDDGAKEQKA